MSISPIQAFLNGIDPFGLKSLTDPTKTVDQGGDGWGVLDDQELVAAGYDVNNDGTVNATEVKLKLKLNELNGKPFTTNDLAAVLGLPAGTKLTADQLKLLGVTDQATIDNYLKEPSTPITLNPDQIKNVAEFSSLLTATTGKAKLQAITEWCNTNPGKPITPQMASALGLSADQIKGIPFMRDGHPDLNTIDFNGLKSLLLGSDPLNPPSSTTSLPVLNNFAFNFYPDTDPSNSTGKLASKAQVVDYLIKTFGMTPDEANQTADYLDSQDHGFKNGLQGDGHIQVNRLMIAQNVLLSSIPGPAGLDGDLSNPTHRLLSKDSVVALLIQSGLSPEAAAAEATRLDNEDKGPGDGKIQANRVIDLLTARQDTPEKKVEFLNNWIGAHPNQPVTTAMAQALGLSPEAANFIQTAPNSGIVDYSKLVDALLHPNHLKAQLTVLTLPGLKEDADPSNPTGKLLSKDQVITLLMQTGMTRELAEAEATRLDNDDMGKGDGEIQANRVIDLLTVNKGSPQDKVAFLDDWIKAHPHQPVTVAMAASLGLSPEQAKATETSPGSGIADYDKLKTALLNPAEQLNDVLEPLMNFLRFFMPTIIGQ